MEDVTDVPNKILQGMRQAVAHARGEIVDAKITEVHVKSTQEIYYSDGNMPDNVNNSNIRKIKKQ